MIEQNLEQDPYNYSEPPAAPEVPAIDYDALDEETRHQIALKYAMETGRFVPRDFIPQAPEPPAPQIDPNDPWEPQENESVKDYTKRMIARERETMRQEFLKETGSLYGVGATHAAANMMADTVERTANLPEAARPYLRELIPTLLQQNPALATKLDETAIKQLAQLAIGAAYTDGKLTVGTPSTQREDFIPIPRGMDLAPGISQQDFEGSIAMWQELRDYPRDEKGNLLRPSPMELRELGVIR